MVYIANAMTPFSPKDVTVYSNCEEVRLTFCKDSQTQTYHKPQTKEGMPSPIIAFKDVFDVMHDKQLHATGSMPILICLQKADRRKGSGYS